MISFFKKEKQEIEIVSEQHALILMAGRRCAFDLKHAANSIRDAERSSRYLDRAEMWLSIFSPCGSSEYRHRLHREISEKEYMIRRYQKILKEYGIEDFSEEPF